VHKKHSETPSFTTAASNKPNGQGKTEVLEEKTVSIAKIRVL
jgi:hypothetical protein